MNSAADPAPFTLHLGIPEWMEIGIGAALLIIFITSLIAAVRNTPPGTAGSPAPSVPWTQLPETRLVMVALPLEILWEIAQFPLYTVWHQNNWGYILYGLIHCTLGDLIILLIAYETVALLSRNRYWYTRTTYASGVLFVLLGASYTVFSEIVNVRYKGTWGYTDAMPLVPMLGIGGTPLLQWLLIPPVILWLMRIIPTSSPAR
jgi:hypothetical protein